MGRTKDRPTIYLKLLVVVSLLNTLAAWVVTRKFPGYRYLIIEEDQLVENLTAVFFFLAFLLGLIFFLKLRRIRNHPVLAAVAFVALLGFLDEISFGERLFHFSVPVVGGVPFDAVHDLIEIIYKNVRVTPGVLITVAICLSAPILWMLYKLTRNGWKSSTEKLSPLLSDPSTYFVFLFVFFIGTAIVIDLDIIPATHWYRRLIFSLEEVFEMNAAFDLYLFCFSLYASMIREPSVPLGEAGKIREEQQKKPKARKIAEEPSLASADGGSATAGKPEGLRPESPGWKGSAGMR